MVLPKESLKNCPFEAINAYLSGMFPSCKARYNGLGLAFVEIYTGETLVFSYFIRTFVLIEIRKGK